MSLSRKGGDLYDSIKEYTFSNSASLRKSTTINDECIDKSPSNLEVYVPVKNHSSFDESDQTEGLEVVDEGYYGDSDQFLDSEPGEDEIFYDIRTEDRICQECGKDHSSKPNFKGVKTSI